MKDLLGELVLVLCCIFLPFCSNSRDLNTKVSNTTGWNYFDKSTTNFPALEEKMYDTPIGMVAIQGGTFTLGEVDEFVTAPRDNLNRSLTVSSFFMDKYEISNRNWNEYLHWLKIVFGDVAPELVNKAKPDYKIWREELAYNEPYSENYFEHPAYALYPIVGITWEQAMVYCQWRTDRVNELALVNSGAIQFPRFSDLQPFTEEEKTEWEENNQGYTMDAFEVPDPDDPTTTITMYRLPYDYIRDKFVFNTEKYLTDDSYTPDYGKRPMFDAFGTERKVNRADGILVASYRLPTESEWEFAAYAPVAGEDGLTVEGKVYPWTGYHPRDLSKKNLGQMQANFVRGRGDMMGVSGSLNDKYVITAPVDEFLPNDFGLYNMAGNVNEWVLDVYRETSNQEVSEYNSFRGNIYVDADYNEEGEIVIDSMGCVKRRYSSDMIELTKGADNEIDMRGYKDGDFSSLLETDYPLDTVGAKNLSEIKTDPTDVLAPRITNRTRVYKGGSWKDRIYWLSPSTRRYLDQDKCANDLGFRCAMSTLGNQINTDIR